MKILNLNLSKPICDIPKDTGSDLLIINFHERMRALLRILEFRKCFKHHKNPIRLRTGAYCDLRQGNKEYQVYKFLKGKKSWAGTMYKNATDLTTVYGV